MVLFPSWLKHTVPSNDGQTERISIAFNLMFRDYVAEASPAIMERKAGHEVDYIKRTVQKVMELPQVQEARAELAKQARQVFEALKEKIFKNVSSRAAEMIKEDLEALGPVKLRDVETAQRSITDVVRKLETLGKLVIPGSGGADQVV